MKNQVIDWSVPQRQSPAALFIILLKVFRSMLRLLWPLLILYVFKGNTGSLQNWELMFALIPVLILAQAVLEFIFYRYFIINNELVIKKGVFRKQTLAVPLEKIQAVHIEQNFLHNLLGTAKISFDGAGTENTEIKIDAVEIAKAQSLKGFIMQSAPVAPGVQAPGEEVLIRLNFKDLLKLSISANHLEALFILLGFLFSILENLKDLIRDRLNDWADQASAVFLKNSVSIFFILLIFSLLTGVLLSTIRTFLNYFNFYISRNNTGFRIYSGLLNVKEKVVPIKKIQYISWKANWLRKKIGLSLLHFHSIGGDEIRQRNQIKVPVTRYSFIDLLTAPYFSLAESKNGSTHLMHPSYATRSLIWPALPLALLPALFAAPWWHWHALWFLLFIPYIFINARFTVKRFRLYLNEQSIFIHKGKLGLEEILLKWSNIQKITLRQSIYQRRHNLANIIMHTGGGIISIKFIPLPLARRICDYSLYKIESDGEGWM